MEAQNGNLDGTYGSDLASRFVTCTMAFSLLPTLLAVLALLGKWKSSDNSNQWFLALAILIITIPCWTGPLWLVGLLHTLAKWGSLSMNVKVLRVATLVLMAVCLTTYVLVLPFVEHQIAFFLANDEPF
jgi:hypothetical protein